MKLIFLKIISEYFKKKLFAVVLWVSIINLCVFFL
jgi:hypothetical protein